MTADTDEKPALPGNHGQFGANNATEDFQHLEDHPTPDAPKPAGSGSGEQNRGPNQTQGGMRS